MNQNNETTLQNLRFAALHGRWQRVAFQLLAVAHGRRSK